MYLLPQSKIPPRIKAVPLEICYHKLMPEFSGDTGSGIEKKIYERDTATLNHLRTNFQRVFVPLGNALLANPEHQSHIQHTLDPDQAKNLRINLNSDFYALEELKRARRFGSNLTEKSIKKLRINSSFNAHLTAILTADGPTVSQYLDHYWEKTSKTAQERISEGKFDYIPTLIIGAGVGGITVASEAAKYSPELAQNQILVIDQGHQPGGPFAVPEGPAWDLNSANFFGPTQLADIISSIGSPRDYAQAPTRHYPGERVGIAATRSGDINQVADYLPNLSQISHELYSNNEEFQRLMSTQLAMLTDNVALDTKVTKVTRNKKSNTARDGSYEVDLEMTNPKTKAIVKKTITTDSIIVASGGGEAKSGLDETDPNTIKVMTEGKDVPEGYFPKYSSTLEAFKALSSRKTGVGRQAIGETVVVIGNKNSMDTVVEALGALADINDESTNSQVKIKDIVIVGDVPDNCEDLILDKIKGRPRYAKVANLFQRQGQANLVRVYRDRAKQLEFLESMDDLPVQDRKMLVKTQNGGYVRDRQGFRLFADNVINAGGFKSDIDKVFDELIPEKEGTKIIKNVGDGNRQIIDFVRNPSIEKGLTVDFDPNFLYRYGRIKILDIVPNEGLDPDLSSCKIELSNPFDREDFESVKYFTTVEFLKENFRRLRTKIQTLTFPGNTFSEVLKPIVLPDSNSISIADRLGQENIYFTGTSSRPAYNAEKISTLPEGSQQVLERVGTENAVAVGFRGPDTAAFARKFFRDNFYPNEPEPENRPIRRIKQTLDTQNTSDIPYAIDPQKKPHLMRGSDWQTVVLAQAGYELQADEFLDTNGLPLTDTIECRIVQSKEGGFSVFYPIPVCPSIAAEIEQVLIDEMVQTGIYEALNNRTKIPENFVPVAKLNLAINRGRIAPNLSSISRELNLRNRPKN